MHKLIIPLSLLILMTTAQADNYVVQYNLEGLGSALEKGSILLVDKTSTPPDIEIPPVEPPTGPVCSYNEDPSNRTMWVNGVNSYYKTFLIYHEGVTIMESTTGGINPDTPKLINGITYSKGIVRFDAGQYPRYELCVETK